MNEFIPGVCAGFVSTFICTPLDCIRLNYQVGNKVPKNIFRGIGIGLLTVPTFWGVYFPLNSYGREKVPLWLSAYLSCCVGSAITTPLWFLRQKIQTGVKHCFKTTPISVYYTGLVPTFILNANFIIQIPLYEYLKRKIENPDTKKVFLITAVSKTVSSSVVYPVDTIRSLMRNSPGVNFIELIKNLKIIEFYRGYSVYLMRSIPYHTSVFCTYEFIKKKLAWF